MGATPAASLNSWDDLLMAYIRGEVNHPIFGVANSDAHNTASIDMNAPEDNISDVGKVKNGVYVKEISQKHLFAAIRQGNLFATTGPSLNFEINGKIMGQTVQCESSSDKSVQLSITANTECPNTELNKVIIIKNGSVIKTIQPTGRDFKQTMNDQVNQKCYYRVEVTAVNKETGESEFAYGNPVFVEI